MGTVVDARSIALSIDKNREKRHPYREMKAYRSLLFGSIFQRNPR